MGLYFTCSCVFNIPSILVWISGAAPVAVFIMDLIRSSQTTLVLQRVWSCEFKTWLRFQSFLLLQVTLAVCFVLMFGNSMLLTSFYASSLVSIWVSLTSGFWSCVYGRKRIGAVLLVFFLFVCFSSHPGNRCIEGSI